MQVIMQIEIYWILPWFVRAEFSAADIPMLIFSMPWAPYMEREESVALFTGTSQAPKYQRGMKFVLR
jgi:hypothetical protein